MNTDVAAGSSSGAGDVTGPPFALEPLPGPPDTLVVHGVEYSIIRALGVGSYAQVVEVCGPGGQRFAAKCIDQAPLSAWARSQLAAEVEIQQSLLHPHILRMHAAGEDKVSGRFVCILDVAHGGELFERIMEEQSFVEDDARRVLKQLLAAVSHMHTHGILHRDLKPENILLETSAADSPIKVADFGSAKRLAPSGPLAHASTPCGSMGYAAPEQIALHRYEREVDMWAVGVIAYVLLSGSMPFDPAHYADALVSDSFEVVLLPEQWADISAPAKDFVLSLLQLQPERRPKVEQALRHPWLQSLHCRAASPLPQPQLCTPRQLKRLRDAGMLHHHWAHANEIWHYACSTPRLGGGMLPELPMPSPLLLPTAVEVPMAREGEVPLLCPPQQVRERAEAQRNKRRKLHSPPAVQPAGGTAAEGSMPPPLARDASFNAFELNGGSPPAGSRGAAGAPHTALEAGTVVGSSELSQKEATLSNEL